VIFGLQIIIFIIYLILAVKNGEISQKYNKVLNLLSIFGSILIVVWLIIRLGVILGSYYYPAATTDK